MLKQTTICSIYPTKDGWRGRELQNCCIYIFTTKEGTLSLTQNSWKTWKRTKICNSLEWLDFFIEKNSIRTHNGSNFSTHISSVESLNIQRKHFDLVQFGLENKASEWKNNLNPRNSKTLDKWTQECLNYYYCTVGHEIQRTQDVQRRYCLFIKKLEEFQ